MACAALLAVRVHMVREGTFREAPLLNLRTMNEARLSHLPFGGPSEGFFLIDSTFVGLTRMKRSSFGLRVRVNPWANLGERFIRVNPTDV